MSANVRTAVQAYMQKTYVCGCMPPYESQVSHRLALSTDWLQYKNYVKTVHSLLFFIYLCSVLNYD